MRDSVIQKDLIMNIATAGLFTKEELDRTDLFTTAEKN